MIKKYLFLSIFILTYQSKIVASDDEFEKYDPTLFEDPMKSIDYFSETNIELNKFPLFQQNALQKSIGTPINQEAFDRALKTVYDIESKDLYIQKIYTQKSIIKKNLNCAAFIINARGDGNCGYRAFLGSALINSGHHHHRRVTHNFKKLFDEKYINLFLEFDQDFGANINKQALAQEIKNYLDTQLDHFNHCRTIEEIHTLLNQEIAFNYYMIMFFRYLIVDYINRLNANSINEIVSAPNRSMAEEEALRLEESPEEERLLADAIIKDSQERNGSQNLDEYKNHILTWQDELTLDQMRILAITTNISIYTIAEKLEFQNFIISNAQSELGIATILYGSGHYKIFIPIQCTKEYLDSIFLEKATKKVYASITNEAQDFWKTTNNKQVLLEIKRNKASVITHNDGDVIEEALKIGNNLLKQNKLDLFIFEYILLNQALNTVTRFNDKNNPTKINQFKTNALRLYQLSIQLLFEKTIENYKTIIQSWNIEKWHLAGYKPVDMKKLNDRIKRDISEGIFDSINLMYVLELLIEKYQNNNNIEIANALTIIKSYYLDNL